MKAIKDKYDEGWVKCCCGCENRIKSLRVCYKGRSYRYCPAHIRDTRFIPEYLLEEEGRKILTSLREG